MPTSVSDCEGQDLFLPYIPLFEIFLDISLKSQILITERVICLHVFYGSFFLIFKTIEV